MNIKTINPIGTAWQGQSFECITLYFGILYAPAEHLVFYPITAVFKLTTH